MMQKIAQVFAPDGIRQKTEAIVAPRPSKLVRCARLLKSLSVAHPASRVPMMPPTISEAATVFPAA